MYKFMTKKEIKQKRNKLDKLWLSIRQSVEENVWNEIMTAVDLEILLEAECGQ